MGKVWQPVTDSRIHKCFARLTVRLGFQAGHLREPLYHINPMFHCNKFNTVARARFWDQNSGKNIARVFASLQS